MEPDDNDAPGAFPTDLFAYHPHPFAAYLESDGFAALAGYRRPNINTYGKALPATVAMARRLLARTPQRAIWGRQLNFEQWITETEGEPVPCRRLASGVMQTRPGQPLRLQDLVKHFIGKTYAVGTTDIRRVTSWYDFADYEWKSEINAVRCLRLDVDDNLAWLYERAAPILTDLREQRTVAHALGLPYRAFRTAGRGLQAVIALPCGCPHHFASYLLESFLWLLEERDDGRTHADKNNLRALMRLPGGQHAKTGNLALWIDIEAGGLYGVEEQARLMDAAFRYRREDSPLGWEPQAFVTAGNAILRAITDIGIGQADLLTRDQMAEVHRLLPDNPIVLRWQQARDLVASWRAPVIGTESTAAEAVPVFQETQAEPAPDILPNEATKPPETPHRGAEATSPPRYTMDWALQVWTEEFLPGGFWDWISMNGKRGILASVILFGSDRAEQALCDLAQKVPARSPSDLRARLYTIGRLWQTFRLKDFTAYNPREKTLPPLVKGEATDEIEELAARFVAMMRERQPKGKWSETIADHTIQTILIALRDSPSGMIEISYRALAASINARWPGESTNHMRVKEMIARLSNGESCVVEMLHKTAGYAWRSQPNLYRVGKELGTTDLGRFCTERMIACLQGQNDAWDDSDDEGNQVT
ncbi:MAG TPA: hypothetical protein VFB38_07100, partial [Chthonomonadaceae bacterium]|nr:hypothetical protein [Chthonomonadaceae bacterium]